MNSEERDVVTRAIHSLRKCLPRNRDVPVRIEAIAANLEQLFSPDTTDEDIRQAYIDAAKEKHGCDGECEIDADAIVSESDDGGAYVQAWVWVNEVEAGIEGGYGICEDCDRNLDSDYTCPTCHEVRMPAPDNAEILAD